MNKNEVLRQFLECGVLVSPDFFDNVPESFDYDSFFVRAKEKLQENAFIMDSDLKSILGININENNSSSVVLEEKKEVVENKIVDRFSFGEESKVVIKESYEREIKKKDVQSFVSYFRRRYESLRKILLTRQELQDSISISRLARKEDRQSVSIIGLVLEKAETKNGNLKITLEDPTGIVNVLINKNKPEIYDIANDLVVDEVIGISGVTGNKIVFCNNLFIPDIPINNELKKAPTEGYVVFISDLHFGIKNFLNSDFMNFISWLKGEYGSKQQRDIASKVKYVFITGDVVEGVGIYPGQEKDLDIRDIYEQHIEAAKYLKLIPERIKVIVCAGNHDPVRMSEPQPLFDKQIAKPLYEIPNLIMVTNPALINIDSCEGFPGFDVLMYHGFSFPYFSENVSSIRLKGGMRRCDLIMKYLLQKRHLAPSHGSTQYLPDEDEDNLVIETVPDIFVTGHIHQIVVGSYRGVSLINSSCWVVQSEDNMKRGIIPHPAKVPIMNLQTREVKIMNFLSEDVKVLFEERMVAKNG